MANAAGAVLICEHCLASFTPRGHTRTGRYCSKRCFGLASRTRVVVTCANPACGNEFSPHPYRLKDGKAPTCSNACRGVMRRRSVERACLGCGRDIVTNPSRDKRYCSWACYGGKAPITCRGCGEVKEVPASRAERGQKYCSMACYERTWREHRLTVRCQRPQCQKTFVVPPSRAGAHYCSQRCNGAAKRRDHRRHQCRACKRKFSRPARRHPRFCSYACRNRGRVLTPVPREPDRNARILELKGQGLKAPAIQRVLKDENPTWWMSPAAIRQVISRAR